MNFASAASAIAISRYPLPLNPPTLPEIESFVSRLCPKG